MYCGVLAFLGVLGGEFSKKFLGLVIGCFGGENALFLPFFLHFFLFGHFFALFFCFLNPPKTKRLNYMEKVKI